MTIHNTTPLCIEHKLVIMSEEEGPLSRKDLMEQAAEIVIRADKSEGRRREVGQQETNPPSMNCTPDETSQRSIPLVYGAMVQEIDQAAQEDQTRRLSNVEAKLERIGQLVQGQQQQTAPSTSTPSLMSNPVFAPIWDQLDDHLQDALLLAASAARRQGKSYISTTNLFAALRRLSPELPLADFFEQLPEGALPESISEQPDVTAIDSIESLSPCVNSAMKHLVPQAAQQQKVSSQDVFIDIALHANGKSTRRLRTHGVDVVKVHEIVKQLGWTVLERR